MFKQRLIETISDVPFSNPKLAPSEDGVLEPVVPLGVSIEKITYSPPCPQCGQADHYNMIGGQPCVPIKIISPEGANCACSPIGEPHSDNCKGLTW